MYTQHLRSLTTRRCKTLARTWNACMYNREMTMTMTIISGREESSNFHGWSVFGSVKKTAPCHAMLSPFSLARLPDEDRERPRARTRTCSLVTGDNILSHHFHSVPLFFCSFYTSPFCRPVFEDALSDKLYIHVNVYLNISWAKHLMRN